MGPGYSQMNDLVIIQTAQGLTVYLEETAKDVIHESGIVIGYDGRHNSRRYVEGNFHRRIYSPSSLDAETKGLSLL